MTIIPLQIVVLTLTIFMDSQASEPPLEVQQLLDQLPACSKLHEALENGVHGDGVDQPYMRAMRQQGVERAEIEVSARRRGNQVKDLEVVRALYYQSYDGPHTQIVDPGDLRRLHDSGLEAMLRGIAFERVKKAPFFTGFEGARHSYKHWASIVEFFSNPWLAEQMPRVTPKGDSRLSLLAPAVSADVLEVSDLLNSHHFEQPQLNSALFRAALSNYDNTAVIRLLLKAGADVNARNKDGNTPLRNAISSPCNLPVLLENGAYVDPRDRWSVQRYSRPEK